MSSKGSRVVRSLSVGEIGLFNQVQPIDPPENIWEKKLLAPKPASKPPQKPVSKNLNSSPVVKQDQQHPRKSVLMLGSPIWEPDDKGSKKKPQEGFGEFLETCSLCKKKLQRGEDTYMYGYLRAFCSPDCRDDQIALDGIQIQSSSEPTKLITGRKDI